jgi:hypothetical protein
MESLVGKYIFEGRPYWQKGAMLTGGILFVEVLVLFGSNTRIATVPAQVIAVFLIGLPLPWFTNISMLFMSPYAFMLPYSIITIPVVLSPLIFVGSIVAHVLGKTSQRKRWAFVILVLLVFWNALAIYRANLQQVRDREELNSQSQIFDNSSWTR